MTHASRNALISELGKKEKKGNKKEILCEVSCCPGDVFDTKAVMRPEETVIFRDSFFSPSRLERNMFINRD